MGLAWARTDSWIGQAGDRAPALLGAEQIFLEVRAGNRAAIALYETSGFAAIGRRIAYYPPTHPQAPREDALVMRRALVTGPRGL